MTDDTGRKNSKSAAQLIASCQGLVRSIAWKIHRRLPSTVDLDDLIGYGQIGLAEAARDYNPERRTEFTTFAYYRIRGAILDNLSRLQWFNMAEYNRGRYEQLTHEAIPPGPEADRATGDDARLRSDIEWFKLSTGALATVYLMCHSDWGHAAGCDVASGQQSPLESAINRELTEKLRHLIDLLPAEGRELVRGVYFEGLSLKVVGERLGISKGWASRLHARTLQHLARALSAEIA